jgi:hypothetical protein
VVDWRTVVVAGLPMWGLVVGVVAWHKLTPRAVAVPTPAPVEPTPPVEVAKAPEVLPPPRPADEPVRKLDPEVAKALADGGKVLLATLFAGKADEDPPLVDIPQPVAAEKKPIKLPDGCKTYDTAIHFVKNLETAQKRAKADGRLVFVLHLSGNIEDPGFT